MRMDWVLLAEGVAQDARGAVTLVGVNQNIQPAPELPFSTKRTVMAYVLLEGEVPEAGQPYNVRFTVTSPSGKIVMAHTGQGGYTETPWKDAPAGLNVMADFPITVNEYGPHVISVEVENESQLMVEGSVKLYVLKPQK